MSDSPLFEAAFPYQDDVLALPVTDLDAAVAWYAGFGLVEIERRSGPVPTVIMERDGVRIGFAINGGDASNEGAAIRVSDVERAKAELEANGIPTGDFRIDESDDGTRRKVFFVVAPDGLCFYVHEILGEVSGTPAGGT